MEGLIRKIVIGQDPKNGMAYVVGKPARRDGYGNEISAIVFDERSYETKNRERYFIYLRQSDGSQVLWKVINEMPSIIEFDLNF